MKKRQYLGIGIAILTTLLCVLGFEWINVQSYYQDQLFVGTNVAYAIHRDVLIIDALFGLVAIILIVCIYKINKTGVKTIS
jgi:hypothetical protein